MYSSKSVQRSPSLPPHARSPRSPSNKRHHGSSTSAFNSSGSTFYDSKLISPEERGSTQEKQRKSKLDKIRELLDENRQLKDEAFHLKQELDQKEVQLRNLDGHPGQLVSGEGTKEGQSDEKHLEALRALTAVTKTQQESLAAHHERSEALQKDLEELDVECKRLRKDLHKKKKEVSMLEKEIDSNLLEITGLRKELAQAIQKSDNAESEIRSDRRKMLELTRELALAKAGQKGASNESKLVASGINVFEEEIKEKNGEIEAQRLELEKQVEQIQRLHVELERTQEQVQTYEKERDATVADMEAYYEALKYELEEKSRLLEVAEREKEEMDVETTAAIRALQDRCDQLNAEVLDAHDEMSILRRDNDASSFAPGKSDATKHQEFEEEKQRLNSNLEALNEELDALKHLHEDAKLKHAEAYQAVEQENGELKRQQAEFKTALREANVRNQTLSQKNEMIKVENESLMEISRDLQLKLREEQTRQESVVTPVDDILKSEPVEEARASASRGESPSSMSYSSSTSLEPVPEDNEENESVSSEQDAEKANGSDSSSTCFSDEAVGDPKASPTPSEGELIGQQALFLAATQSQSSSPASSDDGEPSGQQAMLLAAVAGRKIQKAQSDKSMNSSWRSKISMKRNKNDASKSLPPLPSTGTPNSTSSASDSQIERLEKINAEQKDTIKNLKSEIVRLNAFYRDAAYISKKKVESLTNENAAYEIKVSVLENMLEKIGGPEETLTHTSEGSVGDTDTKDENSVRSSTPSQEEVTPQRDWSSPPKFLDRIKELEEQVSTLERKKNFDEAKLKAVESDLDRHQQHAKIAARDSLLETERLKRENAALQRRLAEYESESFDVNSEVSEKEAVGESDEWGSLN